MKRFLAICVLISVVAIGCGGPKASDPKAPGAKEDPRIQRASPGGGTTTQQPSSLSKPTGKAAE
jgi:hypothetical protein